MGAAAIVGRHEAGNQISYCRAAPPFRIDIVVSAPLAPISLTHFHP